MSIVHLYDSDEISVQQIHSTTPASLVAMPILEDHLAATFQDRHFKCVSQPVWLLLFLGGVLRSWRAQTSISLVFWEKKCVGGRTSTPPPPTDTHILASCLLLYTTQKFSCGGWEVKNCSCSIEALKKDQSSFLHH